MSAGFSFHLPCHGRLYLPVSYGVLVVLAHFTARWLLLSAPHSLKKKENEKCFSSQESCTLDIWPLLANTQTWFGYSPCAPCSEFYSDFKDNNNHTGRAIFHWSWWIILKALPSFFSQRTHFLFSEFPNFLQPGHHLLATRRPERKSVNCTLARNSEQSFTLIILHNRPF